MILAETTNIRAYAANQRRESHGQLTITTTHTQARFVLPPAIARIKREFPQVSVHLQQSAEGAALDLLSQGDADMAVVSTAGDQPQAGIAVPLFALLAAGVPVSFDSLGAAATTPAALGVAIGLLVGKPLGVVGVHNRMLFAEAGAGEHDRHRP